MSKNIKLFKWYIGLSYDFLFFLVVQVFFLNQVKHISMADILLLESLFAIIRLILQVPIMKFVKILGNLTCFRLGPFFTFASLMTYLFAPSFGFLVFASLLKAIGWGFQNISSPSLLYNELKSEGLEQDYGKVQGRAQSDFILINTIASFVSGFLFELNHYIPITLCLFIHFIIIIISFVIKPQHNNEMIVTKNNSVLKDIRKVMNDKFFIYLFIFMMIIWGLLGALGTMDMGYLSSIGISVSVCTMVFAFVELFAFVFARFQYMTDKLFKDKSMYVLAFCVTVPFILIGLFYFLKLPFSLLYICAFIAFLMEYLTRSQFRIYALNYVNKYSKPELATETVGVYYLFESVGRFVITFIAGMVMKTGNIGLSYIILMGIFIIPLFFFANRLTLLLRKK